MAKKMKLKEEESKKNVKATGIKRILKIGKRLFIGGLIITIVVGGTLVFNSKNDDEAPSVYYAEQIPNSYNIIIYERGDIDSDPAKIEDLYILNDGYSNSLIHINPKNTKNITLLHGNTNIDDLEANSKKAIPLDEAVLLEYIVGNSSITSDVKIAGLEVGGSDYNILVRRDSLNEFLMDEKCTEVLDCYTATDGSTYDTLDEYIAATAKLQSSKSK